MKKILITGATGFIGNHCIKLLNGRGYEIHAISREKIKDDVQNNIFWHQIDIIENNEIDKVIAKENPTYLLHLAWKMETGLQLDSSENEKWLSRSKDLVKTFYRFGGKKILVTGTCAEYDWDNNILSEDSKLNPKNEYGRNKKELYQFLNSFCSQNELDYTWARIFFSYGPGQNKKSLIPYVITNLLNNEKVKTTEANQMFDYLYIEDIALAIILLLESDYNGAVNISSGKATKLKEIISSITNFLNKESLIQFGAIPYPENMPKLIVGTNDLLKKITGWKQQYSLDDGLISTISFYQKKGMSNIFILGAGMAGFGASHQLSASGNKALIFEKQSYYGGKTSSFKKDGFTFDNGPHISFTKDEEIQQLFAKSVKNNYFKLQVGVNNFWKGNWIKHPAQVNLYGLPPDLTVSIIEEFIEITQNKKNKKNKIKNFKEWLYASFGKTFAETFPMKYGLKFHTTQAENMSIDWVGPRLYQPNIKEVIYGALSPNTKDVHYVSHFRYPKKGGFVSFLNSFSENSEIQLNHELTKLDPTLKSLEFANGKLYHYDHLISSVPLPLLIPLIKDVPKTVLKASKKLACSTCVIVNIGVNRSNISKEHWSYFYDEEIIFSRLSFPHMQSSNNVPEGCGSIQAEIYFSKKYKPLDKNPEEFVERTISDLIKCNLLKENDEILYKEGRVIPFANVIFDHDRKKNLKIVHSYLDKIGVKYCGRYGEWDYIWTDESFKSGMKAAQKVIDEIEIESR